MGDEMTDKFLGRWQLVPELSQYELGELPRSGTYVLESLGGALSVAISWIDGQGQSGETSYGGPMDGSPIELKVPGADSPAGSPRGFFSQASPHSDAGRRCNARFRGAPRRRRGGVGSAYRVGPTASSCRWSKRAPIQRADSLETSRCIDAWPTTSSRGSSGHDRRNFLPRRSGSSRHGA